MKNDMKREIKLTISEICYYLFFSILFGAKALGFYDGQTVFKICLVVAAGFVLIKMLMTSYSVKELMVMFLALALGMVIYRNSGEKSALVFIVMMAGYKNIPRERIMKTGFLVWATGFSIMVLRSMLGIGSDIVMAHHKFGIDILRRGMGYSHPNVLHVSYAILTVLILFVFQDCKNKIKLYLWVFSGNVVVFLYSVSYTGFMLVTFLIIFHVYFCYRRNFSFIEKICIHMVFPLCILFSLLGPLMLDPDSKLFQIINHVLNQRFYASRLYLQENRMTLFGSRIYASHTFALDNSYVTLLIYGGLILFALITAGYIYSVWRANKEKDVKALSILLSFSIAGVIEPFLFNLSFKNISLLIVAEYLFGICRDERQFLLLSGLDKEFTLKIPMLKRKIQTDINLKAGRKMAVYALALSLISGALFLYVKKMPERIYVDESYCDVDGEKFYINKNDYSNENVVFYRYQDIEHGVYAFDGETLVYEKCRDAVRLMFLVYGVGYLVLSLTMLKFTEEQKRRL